jgi:hypothetical protein
LVAAKTKISKKRKRLRRSLRKLKLRICWIKTSSLSKKVQRKKKEKARRKKMKRKNNQQECRCCLTLNVQAARASNPSPS